MKRMLRALALAVVLGACSRPQAVQDPPGEATPAPVPTSAPPPAAAGAETPWQLRCLARHYPAAAIEPDGLRIGPIHIPFDDGSARTGDDRLEHPDVRDVFEPPYPRGPIVAATEDPGRARLEPLLSATYAPVAERLVTVPLFGTPVHIHELAAPALRRVAGRLETRADLREYFMQMGGTYNDRTIAGTDRKSAHAYGIALDIGTARSDYWRNAPAAPWKNRIPEAIVTAFEAEGFVWGGRWLHYDTMHFEYRPELFDCAAPAAVTYAWAGQAGALPAVDSLAARFAPPQGFHWQAAAPGSFAAYLRDLPLAAKDTPVRSFRGEELVAANDPRIAAVTTLDVGTRDLQQCADAVLRMHAEYKFSVHEDEALVYRAASKFPMPFARWAAGERLVAKGNDLEWAAARGASGRTHENLRSWLDAVFNYANTVSIQRDAELVPREAARAGDFFVQGGWPGHAVLVLAIAEDAAGHRRALLGQSYMPAQSFQVLAVAGDPWFSLDGDTIVTPFWRPFAWTDLRRMP